MRFFILFSLIIFWFHNIVLSQPPVTQVEGYLEVYSSLDTTSTYVGRKAGQRVDETFERFNSFFGSLSGFSNSTGESNNFFGNSAGYSNNTGDANNFYGNLTGYSNTTGDGNSFFGSVVGLFNSSGNNNSFFGSLAGRNIITQSRNIIIGANSGPTTSINANDDRLYIDVQETDFPLIYGEFDNDLLRINGRFQTRVNNSDTTYSGLFEETNDKLFGYEFEYNGSSDKLHLWSRGFAGNEAKRMTWLKNGNVGIGKEDPAVALDVVGSISATGAINGSSDINKKESIIPINNSEILEKVSNLSISEWQYKASSDRHIGPMAQDFYAAFGLGQGETTIATVDADGVALAAIQALARKVENLEKEKAILQKLNKDNQIENEKLKEMYSDLLIRLEQLEKK